MRFVRPFLLGVILAGAFYWFTTHHQGTNPAPDIISRPTHVEISQAAGPEKLDPEEQNNIEVYHRVIPSVVGGEPVECASQNYAQEERSYESHAFMMVPIN